MSKRVYISADYDPDSGDRSVVDGLNKWGGDNYHRVDFTDMAKVVSGSVSMDSDCRICDLKREFNAQINASSFLFSSLAIKLLNVLLVRNVRDGKNPRTKVAVLHINKTQ